MTDSQAFDVAKSAKRINQRDHVTTFENSEKLRDKSNSKNLDVTGNASEVSACTNELKENEKPVKVGTSGEFVSCKSDHANDQCESLNAYIKGNNASRKRRGGQANNQNARKHGRYSEFVPATWLIAADETEVAADLMMIRAHLMETVAYRTEVSRSLARHIASYNDSEDKEAYKEVYEQYRRDIYNADAAIVKWKKLQDEHLRGIDERERVRIDTELKIMGVRLAEAKTEQAKTATALNNYELTVKEKEGLGEKDDLGMELDMIADMEDDEINRRFAERESGRHQ
ncbi:hypothetical protein [Vibrio barjaei]|uniref:hypothetical protein n=1 Tax=Vibrio barjaei TaxID=1676683 RepID=UPI002285089E|nr:hypothetical protein [Vibrio barjaei]MCY9873211.1 hypothetical protein [Vibrio barjaei]